MSVTAPLTGQEMDRIDKLIRVPEPEVVYETERGLADAAAAEFVALGRQIASLAVSAYGRLDAVDLAKLADMAQRCRRNVEQLRGEHGS